jgi:putative glutamine amidotransferase
MAEAIEDHTRPFLLGVQWHAETLIERPEHAALFAALVEAAGARPQRLAAAA